MDKMTEFERIILEAFEDENVHHVTFQAMNSQGEMVDMTIYRSTGQNGQPQFLVDPPWDDPLPD
jgi:hypothetical protein